METAMRNLQLHSDAVSEVDHSTRMTREAERCVKQESEEGKNSVCDSFSEEETSPSPSRKRFSRREKSPWCRPKKRCSRREKSPWCRQYKRATKLVRMPLWFQGSSTWEWRHDGIRSSGVIEFAPSGVLYTSMYRKRNGKWKLLEDGRMVATFGKYEHILELLPSSSPPEFIVVERRLRNGKSLLDTWSPATTGLLLSRGSHSFESEGYGSASEAVHWQEGVCNDAVKSECEEGENSQPKVSTLKKNARSPRHEKRCVKRRSSRSPVQQSAVKRFRTLPVWFHGSSTWIWCHDGHNHTGVIKFAQNGVLHTSMYRKKESSWELREDGSMVASFGKYDHVLQLVPMSTPPEFKVVERRMRNGLTMADTRASRTMGVLIP